MFGGNVDRSIGKQRLQLDLATLENFLSRPKHGAEGADRLELKGKLNLPNICITVYQLVKDLRITEKTLTL